VNEYRPESRISYFGSSFTPRDDFSHIVARLYVVKKHVVGRNRLVAFNGPRESVLEIRRNA